MADISKINGNNIKDAVARTDIANIKNGTTAIPVPLASSTTRGGIKTGYGSNGNYRAVSMSGENAYVYIPSATTSAAGLMSAADKSELASALIYKAGGSCAAFGGTAYYIIYSDGIYNFISIYGMTGYVADGGQATWAIPSTIYSTYRITGRKMGLSFTQIQSGGLDQYKNGVDVEAITETGLTIKSNTNTSSRFLFVGFGRS